MKKFAAKRPIKVPTPESLSNAALFYLGRYAASEASLRRVLQNRLRRACMGIPALAEDVEKQNQLRLAIETIIERHLKTGTLNDAAYAETKINGLRRAGRSRRVIHQKLSQRGVKNDVIEAALVQNDDGAEPEEAEMKAALSLAKRRKLGCFRTVPADVTQQRKDMAILCRAGFSFALVKKILGGDGVDEEMFCSA